MRRNTQAFTASLRRRDGHTIDGEPGDCLRTSLSCVLDLDRDEVPNFARYVSWWDAMRRWLRERGQDLWFYPDAHELRGSELVILSGPSPRGAFFHCVVGTASSKVVWDPHPSRAGLVSVVEMFALAVPYWPPPQQLALP